MVRWSVRPMPSTDVVALLDALTQNASAPNACPCVTHFSALRCDNVAMQMLHDFAEEGGDVASLLRVAGAVVEQPDLLVGGVGRAEWAAGTLTRDQILTPVDVQQMLDAAERHRVVTGDEPPHVDTLRAVRAQLAELHERDLATDQPTDGMRSAFPAAIAIDLVVGQAREPLTLPRGRGRPVDAQQVVATLLVAGHVHAVCGEPRARFSARLLHTALGVRLVAPDADEISATLERLRRHWATDKSLALREHAAAIANSMGLQVRLPGVLHAT